MAMIRGARLGEWSGAAEQLFVGNLDPKVTEEQLLHAFGRVATILSVHIGGPRTTGAFCYAFIYFLSHDDAEKALKAMNNRRLKGRRIQIMWPHRKPLMNLFVRNLDRRVDRAGLEHMFSAYGEVVSCKVATDEYGKRIGFVRMGSEDAALSAIASLDGRINGTKKLYVSKLFKRNEWQLQAEEVSETNLYIKNLDRDTTKEYLLDKFTQFGKVRSTLVMLDEHGKSRGCGFVNFELPEDAKKALQSMNGSWLGSRIVYVSPALRKLNVRRR